ncbi:hypothetical protein QFZ39_000842 [Paraburkholderia graminis]|nr:hypothetical protein [Paraburkholderia graminis]
MNQPRLCLREHARREQRRADRIVVGQHGEHGVAPKRLDRRGHRRHTVHCSARAVPRLHAMSGVRQIARHRASHRAKTDDADFHEIATLIESMLIGSLFSERQHPHAARRDLGEARQIGHHLRNFRRCERRID